MFEKGKPPLIQNKLLALAEAALTPLSTIYSSWEGEFVPQTLAQAQSINEYAMQEHTRGRGLHLQAQSQPLPSPSWEEHNPQDQSGDFYYRYSSASSHSMPNQSNDPFIPIYMSQDHSTTIPSHQTHQYASSMTDAPLSDAEAEAKRVRNTAASARFRRKKKAREASLERQSREKREALAKLENRITELEDENKFLKGLILWKREGNDEEKSAPEENDRKGRERKDGVGT